MGKFKGPSPKRHLGWSNDEEFMQQLMTRGGYLSSAERQRLGESKLCKKSQRQGRPTFTGCKQLLKQSQSFICNTAALECGFLRVCINVFWM